MSHKYETKKEAILKAKELGCIGTHEMKDGKFMPCKSHEKYLQVTKERESPDGEIDELIDKDGTFLSSKIPILDPAVTPRKTMDQTVAMARNVYDIFRMGYIKTKMLANQKIPLPAIDPDEAAKKILLIVKNKKAGNFYVPEWWNLVSIAIRLSPWWIFKRLRV